MCYCVCTETLTRDQKCRILLESFKLLSGNQMSNVLVVRDFNHSKNDWEEYILCASNTDIIKFLECIKYCLGISVAFSVEYPWEEKLKFNISRFSFS